MFAITGSKGFHIKFENGVTVSVQFGGDNYCDNKSVVRIGEESKKHLLESSNAEIAVWDKSGTWLTQEWKPSLGDDVAGWIEPAELLNALNWAAKYGKQEEETE